MAEIIAMVSGKGGVGKTTSTANIGTALALMGKKVLLVDGDIGLRNLDVVLGIQDRVAYDFNDVLNGACDVSQAVIVDERYTGLHMLPAPQGIQPKDVRPEKLHQLLGGLSPYYDYILIDCPAGIHDGFRLMSAAAQTAIVISTPETIAVRDADRTVGMLEQMHFEKIYLIINRIRVDMVKKGDMLPIDDIVSIVGATLIGAVPDEAYVIKCSNDGTPAVRNAKSRAGKAYANIARRLTGVKVPILEDEKKSFIKRIFKL